MGRFSDNTASEIFRYSFVVRQPKAFPGMKTESDVNQLSLNINIFVALACHELVLDGFDQLLSIALSTL